MPAKRTPKPKAEGLTPLDAHNILMLLDRVQSKGVQEALVMAHLAQKLNNLRKLDPTIGQKTDGKDATPAS